MTNAISATPIKQLFVVGIPRSGSTLTAALVDSLDNSFCLSEPAGLFIPPEATNKADYVRSCVSMLERTREKILSGEEVTDQRRNSDGSPTTNYLGRRLFGKRRKVKFAGGVVDTSRFSEDMLVAIKHNIPFLSVLQELVNTGVPVVGVIRNPISTILSWQETGLPVSKGYMPSAQAFWPELNSVMKASSTEEEGWAKIYDLCCQRMVETEIPVLTYEDLTRDVTKLEEFVGRRSVREVEIRAKSDSDYTNSASATRIRDAVNRYAGYVKNFYREF